MPVALHPVMIHDSGRLARQLFFVCFTFFLHTLTGCTFFFTYGLKRPISWTEKTHTRIESESKSDDSDEKQPDQTEHAIADLHAQFEDLHSIVKDQLHMITGLKADLDAEIKNHRSTIALVDRLCTSSTAYSD